MDDAPSIYVRPGLVNLPLRASQGRRHGPRWDAVVNSALDANNDNRHRAGRGLNRSWRPSWRWPVANILKSLYLAAALALGIWPQAQAQAQAQAPVVVSSKLSS